MFLALFLSAARTGAQVTGIEGVDLVARLTGAESINNTPAVGIGGTDLGHMVVHQGRTFFLFGDTFSGSTPDEGGHWRWNTLAWSSDPTPADGILFDGWITGGGGLARQVIRSNYMNPITEIPTGAISLGDRIYAWFMSVNWWGPPGQWTINYAGLAYTEDDGQSFTVVPEFRLPGNTNFGMVAASLRTDLPAGQDPHVYVWGTPSGRLGGIKLARVLPAEIADATAYQYFGGLSAGQPVWVQHETSAPLIVPPTVGELSVMYNSAARRWTMLYFNHSLYRIEVRQSRTPWGPWSNAISVVPGYAYPGLYGSYMNPLYVENHGQTVYFTMSLWQPYDVFLMRLRLKVAEPLSPADLDRDGDVDLDDLAVMQRCLAGRGLAGTDPECSHASMDGDGDVDGDDVALLRSCLSGADVPADPNCPG